MKSKYFYLAVIVTVFIISCAGTSPQIERSEVEYWRPQTSNGNVVGKKVAYQLWYDKSKWRVVEHDEPFFKSMQETAKKRNSDVSNALWHNSNEIGAGIEESRIPISLEINNEYATKSLLREGWQIIDKEIRVVNGSEVLYMKISKTIGSVKYIYWRYSLTVKSGSLNVLAFTSENLSAEHESEIFKLLNGLVDPNSEMQPTKSNEDIESKLQKLKNLRDKGLITQEDYDKKKNELLNSY